MKKLYYTYPARLICLLLCVAALAVTCLRVGDGFPAGQGVSLDAERTRGLIAELDVGPRPRGSQAQAQLRDRLSARITALGLTPVEVEYAVTSKDLQRGRETATLYPESRVTNLLVEIPGKRADVLLISAHYDSFPVGPGVGNDLVSVAQMLQALELLSSATGQPGLGRTFLQDVQASPPGAHVFENTLVFLFTDGGEEGGLGAACLAQGRAPLAVRVGGQAVSGADQAHYMTLFERVGMAVSLDAWGSGGPQALLDTGAGNARAVSLFAAGNPGVYVSSLLPYLGQAVGQEADFAAYQAKGVQGLNPLQLGRRYLNDTELDDAALLRDSALDQRSAALLYCLDRYGDLSLSTLSEVRGDVLAYDYLGLFTLALPPWTAWAGAGAMLVLLIVWILRASRKTSAGRVMRGFALGLMVLVAGLAAGFFAVAGLMRILPALGGALAARLASPLYGSLPLTLGLCAGGLCAALLVWGALAKVLLMPGRALREAAVLAMVMLGIACALALPEASYLFIPAGLAGLALMILTTLRQGEEPPPLGMYALVFAVYLPCALSLSLLAAQALGAPALPMMILPALLGFALVAPYALDIPTRRRTLGWLGAGLALLVVCGALVGVDAAQPYVGSPLINLGNGGQPLRPLYEDNTLIYVADTDVDGAVLEIRDADFARPAAPALRALGFEPHGEALRLLEQDPLRIPTISITARYDDVLRQTQVHIRPAYDQGRWELRFPSASVTSITYTLGEDSQTLLLTPSLAGGDQTAVVTGDRDAVLTFHAVEKMGTMFYTEYLPDTDVFDQAATAAQVLAQLDSHTRRTLEIRKTVFVP